ncbi:MAG TPA: 50S ribosomal protein L32, partial [Candidatus Paceibacterota bacterium]
VCQNCGAKHRPHHMCLDCGHYNGRQVVDLAEKKKAREARMSAKREAIRSQAGLSEVPEETKESK